MAERLLGSDADEVGLVPGLELRLDRRVFEREIDARIQEAVESIVPARRGRPPKR
jgi:hypothetical protein